MRPNSIRKFDLFYLASIAIAVAQALLNYDAMKASLETQLGAGGMAGSAGSLLPLGLAIGFALSLGLWFLVSRMRQGWARWALVLFVAWRALSIPSALATGLASLSITGAIAALLQVIALGFLFQPDARAWFARSSD